MSDISDIVNVQIADRIYYEITSKCNLNCIHCSDMQNAIPNTEINEEELFKFHEEISKKIEINSVVITGGEPVLHLKFYSILEYFLKKSLMVLVTTNGLLLDLERIEKLLVEYPKLRIQISLDGITKPVYERIRGRETWEELQGLINRFRNKPWSRQIGISLTIMKQNQEQVLDAISFTEKLGFGFIHFPVLLCIGAAKKRWKEIAPEIEKQLEIERMIFSKIANHEGELNITSNRLEQILSSVVSKGKSHCRNAPILKVASDGLVYSCPAAFSNSIGKMQDIEIVNTIISKLVNSNCNKPIYRKSCEDCEVSEFCSSTFCSNCINMLPVSEETFHYTCHIVKTHLMDALHEINESKKIEVK